MSSIFNLSLFYFGDPAQVNPSPRTALPRSTLWNLGFVIWNFPLQAGQPPLYYIAAALTLAMLRALPRNTAIHPKKK